MGMTKAFYFIRNRKQTQEELEQQLNGFKAVMQQYSIEDLRIYYGRGLGWFPVFSEELVWQAENLDEDLLKEMGNHFQAIVMALSVLDDDVAVSYTHLDVYKRQVSRRRLSLPKGL